MNKLDLNKVNKLSDAELKAMGMSQADIKALRIHLKTLYLESKKVDKYIKENKIFFFKPPPPNYKRPVTKEELLRVKERFQNYKQVELFKAWRNKQYKKVCYVGANRTGKTTAGICICISSLLGYYPWDEQKTPLNRVPFKVLLVGHNWEENIKTTIIPKLQDWWPKSIKVETRNNSKGVKAEWFVENGSYLKIMSNTQSVDAFESANYDMVIWDEPPDQKIYYAVGRGLMDSGGRHLFVMTLLAKQAWVARDVILRFDEKGLPDRTVYTIRTNIYDAIGFGLLKEDVLEYAKDLPEHEKYARLEGGFGYMTNLVYPKFDRNIHIIDDFDIPCDWPVDIAMDFHPSEKQAVLFMATSNFNEKFIFHEIWEYGNPQKIAHKVIKFIKSNGLRVNRIVIDPSTKGDRNSAALDTTYNIVRDILAMFGYPLEAGSKDRDSCEFASNEMLMSMNNRPYCYFFRSCKRAIYEVEGLTIDPKTGKRVDKDDHMCENWGRLAILKTKYVPLDIEDLDKGFFGRKIKQPRYDYNPITGY